AAYQADDLDAYDSDCDEINSAKIALMNSTLPALQDDLISNVIEQLKTQVVTCTKINQDNKQEINSLKHTLSEYLKERESFEKKISILKDDLQKEESKNIDRELALEKEKAQQLKPNLYDSSVIGKSDVIMVPDSENTLMHAEEIVKERTTATAITEGTWGFEHTKACFHDDIISFVKNLKDLFTSFDQYLIDEVSEVQKIFKQMEMAVEQNCAVKTEFQTKMESVLKENDRLLKHALEQLKGKAVLSKAVSLNPIDPALLQVDVVPLIPRLRRNRTAHIDYLKHTLEEAATLRELVESE
nr:hypothetical protein [Tanacetum cinerariifolium]